MQYFVQDGTLHRYPLPQRCTVAYHGEQIRDTAPHDARECIYCLRHWPGDEETGKEKLRY